MSDTDTIDTEADAEAPATYDLYTVIAIGEDADDGADSLTAYYEEEDAAREAAEILSEAWNIVLLFAPDSGADEVYEERLVIGFWPTVDQQAAQAAQAVETKPKAKVKKAAAPVPESTDEPKARAVKTAPKAPEQSAAKAPVRKAKKVAKPII